MTYNVEAITNDLKCLKSLKFHTLNEKQIGFSVSFREIKKYFEKTKKNNALFKHLEKHQVKKIEETIELVLETEHMKKVRRAGLGQQIGSLQLRRGAKLYFEKFGVKHYDWRDNLEELIKVHVKDKKNEFLGYFYDQYGDIDRLVKCKSCERIASKQYCDCTAWECKLEGLCVDCAAEITEDCE
jgi:hypothetical protein